MASYELVDLSAACNAGVGVLGEEPGEVPLGRVDLRGLPFLIGSEPPSAERCFLLPAAPMPVGIGRLARRVIVAHRLLEPGAPAGHAVGQIVAEYAFHLAGGEVVTAPIRERFEIQVVPPGWGRLPFLAVTDTSDRNLPRFEGSWGESGARLAEHAMGWPAGYFLWCWENPHPDRLVERIEAELGGALDATLSDWADRTHAQGGTVVAAHFPNPNAEPAVLVATGRADAVEMLSHSDDAMLEYYRYLNSGCRLPLVGGTDKMSSAVPVGLYRTYARLDEEFSYEAWCRAVRSGRTFLSGGPLVTLSVDGCEPGGTVQLSGPGTVSVHAAVRSIFPLHSLEVVRNGEVVARAEALGRRQAEISAELRVDGNSWIACRAFGADYHLDEWGRRVFAHTSPVYVACGGDWTMTDPEGIRYMRTLVEGAREYVRHTAVRRSDQLTTHHHGEADHLAWLERPFTEALRALEERGRG